MEKRGRKLKKSSRSITYANLSAQNIKIKKDKHFRKRGGTTKIITVSCRACKKLILVYQKDGPGWLKRCYLNRIIFPEKYSSLQNDKSLKTPSDLGNLRCSCRTLIGTPIQHKDARLAFKLIRKSFKRKTPKKLNLFTKPPKLK